MLFGDIYDWAGTARTSILAKSDFMGPGGQVTAFAPPRQIVSDASRIFEALQPVEALAALSRAEFASAAASLLVQINNLHPFREGNGRAQRSFLRHLAAAAGHDLAWDVVTHERMVSVSIAGARGDGGPMSRLLAEVLDPDRVRALRKALGHLRRHWAATWNDICIATTVAGQVYSGVMVGRTPVDFMMRFDASRQGSIAIGGDSDLPAQAKSGDPIGLTSSRW